MDNSIFIFLQFEFLPLLQSLAPLYWEFIALVKDLNLKYHTTVFTLQKTRKILQKKKKKITFISFQPLKFLSNVNSKPCLIVRQVLKLRFLSKMDDETSMIPIYSHFCLHLAPKILQQCQTLNYAQLLDRFFS